MDISKPRPRKLAAILTDRPLAIDDALACFALALRERGLGVRGFLATSRSLANGTSSPALVDLDSCHTILPANAIPEHLQATRGNDIAEHQADLILLPRFAESIAPRQEFTSALSALINAGTPVLTSVRSSHFADWQALTDNRFILLQPTLQAMFDWIEAVWQSKPPTFH